MTDKPIDVVVNARINQQALNQAIAGVKALEGELKKFQRISDDAIASQRRIGVNLTGAGQAFRNFAGQVKSAAASLADFAGQAIKVGAKVGAGIFGGATASTLAYGQKFGGVEGDATRAVAAQKALSDAFTDMGRVLSRVINPVLETFADLISLATQALDELIPQGAGNPLETFIKDAIPNAIQVLALLTDGVKIGAKLLEGIFDEAATAIRKFINTGVDTFKNFGEVVKVRAESIFDGFATGFRKALNDINQGLRNVINGLIDAIASLVEKVSPDLAKSLRAGKMIGLPAGIVNAGEDAALAGREAGRNKQLANLYSTSNAQNKIEDDLLKDRQAIRQKELAAIAADAADHLHLADDIREALKRAGENRKQLNTITKEFVDAYINFRKQTKEADDRLKAGQDQARKTREDADAKAQEAYNEARGSLEQEYMDSQLKATRQFIKAEEKEQTAAGKERLRILRDLEARLTDLAAARDVAGFIQAQREGKRQLDDQAEQASDAAKERQAAFEEQQEEAQENYQKQRDALDSNLNKQFRQNEKAYNDQLRLLNQKHQDEKRAAMTAYAEQLAMLQGSNAQLNAAYAQHYAQMSAEAEAFVARNQATLNRLYQGATGSSTTTSTYDAAAEIARAQTTSSYQQAQKRNTATLNDLLRGGIPKFHDGGIMPRDGLALLRRGERISTPEQQAAGGQPITVYVNNTVGDVATKSMLDRSMDYVIDRVATGLTNALVPGGSSG